MEVEGSASRDENVINNNLPCSLSGVIIILEIILYLLLNLSVHKRSTNSFVAKGDG